MKMNFDKRGTVQSVAKIFKICSANAKFYQLTYISFRDTKACFFTFLVSICFAHPVLDI